MNAVGIDVSKSKSTVTIRRPGDEVVLAPRDYRHTQSSINDLIAVIYGLEGETKVCMDHTGRYYGQMASWLSSAGIFVYMTAGANKFLRIYYGRVREFLSLLGQEQGRE